MTDERTRWTRLVPVVTRRRFAVACAVLLVSITTSPAGQTPGASFTSPAVRAFETGRYDEVEGLLQSSTDQASIVLRARAHIARGRYDQAQKLLTAAVASAPLGDAALELGQLHLYLGRRDEGQRLLQNILARAPENTAADLVRLGAAARALGRFQDANSYLRDATRLAPQDPVVNTAWGDLFLEKYNRPDALKSYQAAIKANAEYPAAQLGLARTMLDEDPPAAKAAVEAALKINPNYVPAHLLVAELALDNRDRAEARTSLQKALDVNPNNLEARALDGAIAFLEGRTADFQKIVDGILAANPSYADAYRMAGDHAARNYRFDEAVELTRRALALDGTSVKASADLGMHLLRTGDEAGARRSLETAFKADPYDVVTFNLLAMLDTVDTFETIKDGDLVVRLHPDEAAVMREFVVPLAREALETLSKQYQFRPQGPILVEMFPKHDDFAVRTIGLPGFIGALGACFGRVVTLDSPRARPPGTFSWAATLWHEMAHVISLQMSDNRVPRWISEGMSDFEERRARPEWGHERMLSFVQAFEAGKLLKLENIGDGLMDPRMTSIVYAHASLVIEHLVELYGEPAMGRMLRAFAKGLETDAAFKEAFNTTLDGVQLTFDSWLERKFADVLKALKSPEIPQNATAEQLKALAADNPDSFRVQMMLARQLFDAGEFEGAIQALERAAKVVPIASGDANPNAMIAAVATKQGDTARAIQALEAVVRIDASDVEAARQLAALLEPTGDAARTAAAYARVAELDPFDVRAQSAVGRHALRQKNADGAVRAFRAVVASGPADRATAYADLAEAYLLSGSVADAKREALAALEIAPSFERAQDLLLRTVTP